jgi:spore maturation protein CgeB/GT2 family glycosyltransferase
VEERARRRGLRASLDQEHALAASIAASMPAGAGNDAPMSGALVSIVILSDGDQNRLMRCLEALRATAYRDVQIVVDAGSSDGSAQLVVPDPFPYPLRIVRRAADGLRWAAADEAAGVAAGEHLVFMTDHVEPVTPGWLGYLVETLSRTGAAAVGPRLIRPSWRGKPGAGPNVRDLSLHSRGIGFDRAQPVPMPEAMGDGEDPTSAAATAIAEVPALSGACLLVRRSAFDAVGGFAAGLDGGFADADLSVRLRAVGERLFFDGRAAMWHHAPAASEPESAEQGEARASADRDAYVGRWAPRVFRNALADALSGGTRWSARPFHVGITLTRDDPSAGYGDWYTAHELGAALEGLGWRVSYLERHAYRWYEPDPSIEAVIVLLESCDIRRLPRRLVTLAWIRNWAERWLSQPWFDEFDLVFASSARIAQLVRDRSAKVASVLPIATNTDRFHPQPADPTLDCDVLFVGSYWGQDRDVVQALPALAAGGVSVHVYGRGWDALPEFAGIHRGFLDYDRVPAAYASARVVVDDAASSTLPYGSVNSRVFDALATGAIVVSNGVLGVEELFDASFPTWSSADALVRTVHALLADADGRAATAERYRAVVIERHTYPLRAAAVRDALMAWTSASRWGIRIGVPSWDLVDSWGDYHFARAVQRALERAGVPTRIHLLREWSSDVAARDDVSVHVFGLKEAPIRPAQVNLLWHISHPELASPAFYDRYDQVFVASDSFAARLAPETRVPVQALHQATDPERFRPDPSGPHHELLYVANSRKVARKITRDLAGTKHDLAVYGGDWTADLIEPRYVKGESIPNAELARYYSSAAIVLNDHWDDMRTQGFLSNRLYDALACGAFVISDDVEGIEAEFDGAVVTYREARELDALIERYLAQPSARRRLGERGRRAVLKRHTFEARVRTLTAAAAPLVEGRAIGTGRASLPVGGRPA